MCANYMHQSVNRIIVWTATFHSFYFSLFVCLLFLSRIHHMSQLKMLNYLVHLLKCVAENFSRTMHRIQIISHKKCGSPEAVLPFNPIHTRSLIQDKHILLQVKILFLQFSCQIVLVSTKLVHKFHHAHICKKRI